MKVGVTLPTFRGTATEALDVARRAEAAGLDGVFVFDHIWPARQPERPALSAMPTLGAVAASTVSVSVGTLVARVGLLPDAALLASLLTVQALSGGRLVAGIGTGDRLSAEENLAYGVPYPSAAERRSAVRNLAERLVAAGVPTWVGGRSAATQAEARAAGAALNLWGAAPGEVSAEAVGGEVTWAGPVPGDPGQMAAALEGLAGAGATWAVCAWPVDLEALGAIARELHGHQRAL